MTSANRRFAQKAIAVVVIVTMLYGAGVAPVVMMFISGVVLVVFLVSRRSQNRDVERMFEFYIAADAILRDEERRWYGFEVAEVIEEGELVFEEMPDPPPIHIFALGALHNLIGNYSAAAEYLSRVVENEDFDERNRSVPSAQLRHYVTLLRRIEGEPSLAPQTLGAIRSLERMRRKHAFTLLTESRKSLKMESRAGVEHSAPQQLSQAAAASQTFVNTVPTPTSGARPPIREVLNDIYRDEQTPSN
jgi:hypothetical protein